MPRPTGPVGAWGDASTIERAEAAAARLRRILPPDLLPLFGASFIRSHLLYDEFVYRLALRVVQESGLEAALREPGSTAEIAARGKLEAGRALVPLDWILRRLAAGGALAEAETTSRFCALGPLPALDPAPVREEQLGHDSSWLPSYVVAETAGREYPAFLRGQVAGEAVLFSPSRLPLWVDYFSNENGLYVVNNRVGAVAVEQWSPRVGGEVLELGGGLGSGALAVLERLEAAGRLAAIGRYHFTELVPAFLRRGQRTLEARYQALARLTFGTIDMNQSFAVQGIAPGRFSVVYAVNTLHVAHDLDFTLGEVRRALEPGGRLIACECVRPWPGQPIYAEFVFNLMETFRSPRQHALHRPGGGFLTPEQWQGAMERAGFADIRFLPDISRIREAVSDFFVAAIGATRPG